MRFSTQTTMIDMEQHPVPRNITGFQFKLIGDMTLKQFGYLASGAIFGYALFKLLPFPSFINIAIGGLIFLIGFAFAFLPFQDRPLDQWLFAFIKSVYSPTQYLYLKNNQPPDILHQVSSIPKHLPTIQKQQFNDSKKMLAAYLAKMPKRSSDFFDQNERAYLNQTLALFELGASPKKGVPAYVIKPKPTTTPPPKPAKPTPPTNQAPIIQEVKKERKEPPPVHAVPQKPQEQTQKLMEDTIQVRQLSTELEKLRQEMRGQAVNKSADPLLEKRFLELEQKLTSLLTEREKMTAELAQFRKQESFMGNTVQPKQAPEQQQSRVNIISQKQATNAGILSPGSVPNLVMGIIYDPTHSSLSNVLITVKDMRGTPLRALKTNQLGQFFASTPLENGTYVMEIEDPQKRFAFDLVELKLTGEIFQPLEIIAKRKVDPVRDQLTKELFQKNFS